MKKRKKIRFKLSCDLRMWIEQCPSTIYALFSSYIGYCYKLIIYRVCWFAPNFLFPFSNGINWSCFFLYVKNCSALSLYHVVYQFTWFDRIYYSFSFIIGVMWFLLYFYSETLMNFKASVNRTINFISIENGPTPINRHFIH